MAEPITGHIAVLGAGRSGRAVTARLAADAERGVDVQVTLIDSSSSENLESLVAPLRGPNVEVRLGSDVIPPNATLVVASPGLPPTSQLMQSARSLGVPIVSEIELAYRLSDSPWIAVTGTNGKTTTTTLTAHLLSEAGLPTETVGNIGRAAASVVGDLGPATVLVAEVSSFQLALTERFHPRVAVLLNITPDHIDWHGSLEAYAADKARVFANLTVGDTAVIDIDDSGSAPYAASLAGSGVDVRTISRTHAEAFGRVENGVLVLGHGSGRVELCRVDELMIRGDHNVSNALAAAAAAHSVGVGAGLLADALRTFEPIEHRLEPVGVVGGVEYFNDSKATNPDAVLKALTAFDDRPLVILLGGHNKGNDFSELATAVCDRCRAAVVFGESTREFLQAFEPCVGYDVIEAHGMEEAVHAAAGMALPGDVVLLSPACASFDEFNDFEHRGRAFREIVSGMSQTDVRS
ncbi:MAG: UDP-N-acetylmuramoyl-L-alanine--D-glutamate ligase [Actinobacteria bacterium HGW-Actinobacteria-1]|jgi:UDP-N-acetylmuramoylalanine--D-glutamate ligase|nr:MAG: UDP-N-acetylmuramoyl-L-alanine--D-glutamate ligase [Actinobacteria bacterium HGW-Actinobacteria-1]